MESKEKKQVVGAINKSGNILITVGVSPDVDELSALLGLTLALGKLDKHATAIFSGTIPPVLSFLEPDKAFEDTVDGLRDFIIALNKEKADHLRYKLDGDVVKIFITPYKNTIIRDTDLEFSQGDFNVDLVIALGVGNKADLDTAVASHGRILHDATTVSISVGSQASELGEINWNAPSASSLCEMIVSLTRDIGDDLIDERVATALLTGIVSNTDRFSNELTTSDVMKTAAALMANGANQQLISARLEEAEETPQVIPDLPELPVVTAASKPVTEPASTMRISHDLPPLESMPPQDIDQELQDELDKVVPPALPAADLHELTEEPVAAEPAEEEPATPVAQAEPESAVAPAAEPDQGPSRRFNAKASNFDDLDVPSLGGTLNATTEQAEEDNRTAVEDERNHVILSHGAPGSGAPANQPQAEAPASTPVQALPAVEPSQPSVDGALANLGYPSGSHPTLADLDQKANHTDANPPLGVDDARAAVATALDSAFTPANNPSEDIGSRPLGDVQAPAAPAPAQVPAPTALELPPLPPLPGQAGPLPPLPPLPDIGELDAHAGEHPAVAASQAPSDRDWQSHTVEPPVAHDPGQFRIPGQK